MSRRPGPPSRTDTSGPGRELNTRSAGGRHPACCSAWPRTTFGPGISPASSRRSFRATGDGRRRDHPVRSDLDMQTTIEETDQHVVRLTVEVPPDEFAKDLDRTYRKLAGQVKIPGFRKGHVPRPIIDARVGRDAVFHEFVEE